MPLSLREALEILLRNLLTELLTEASGLFLISPVLVDAVAECLIDSNLMSFDFDISSSFNVLLRIGLSDISSTICSSRSLSSELESYPEFGFVTLPAIDRTDGLSNLLDVFTNATFLLLSRKIFGADLDSILGFSFEGVPTSDPTR